MQQHGGRYSVYNRRSIVTHVIATNLCGAKLKDLKSVSPATLRRQPPSTHPSPPSLSLSRSL